MNYKIKSAVAFFFLFFLQGTSIGNGQQGISPNVRDSAMSSGGFGTTHFKFSTNDNRKHRASRRH